MVKTFYRYIFLSSLARVGGKQCRLSLMHWMKELVSDSNFPMTKFRCCFTFFEYSGLTSGPNFRSRSDGANLEPEQFGSASW